MHSFNDSVVYVRNGKPIPAIVLKSQETPGGELLTLLYADPDAGPALVSQGTTRGIAQVQNAVAPWGEGRLFGWIDPFDGHSADAMDSVLEHAVEVASAKHSAPEQLDEAQGPVTPGDPESPHAPGYASFHVIENQDGTLESHPGSYPENNPPSDSEREIAFQKAAAIPTIETADYRPSPLPDGSEAVVNPPAL